MRINSTSCVFFWRLPQQHVKKLLTRGGLESKGLSGIPYKKFFKIPRKPLFVTFCMGDYKSLAEIAALPQWQVRPCFSQCYCTSTQSTDLASPRNVF
jgi:hypothetical protein